MFPYKVQYTESEYDIQNSNLLYKTPLKHQNVFETLGKFETSKNKQIKILFCIIYEFDNSYFRNFGIVVILRFVAFYIYNILHV